MSTTCVKGIPPDVLDDIRGRVERREALARDLVEAVDSDWYSDTVWDRTQIGAMLEEQRADVGRYNKESEKPESALEIPALKILEDAQKSSGNKSNPLSSGNLLAGDVGERVAIALAVEKLGLTLTGFKTSKNGFDGIFGSPDGSCYVILEAKNKVDASGLAALSSTKHGKQLSQQWVNRNLSLMQRPDTSQCTETNRRLAEEISSKMGGTQVRRVLVHLNPHTMNIIAYEVKDEAANVLEPIAAWKFEPKDIET